MLRALCTVCPRLETVPLPVLWECVEQRGYHNRWGQTGGHVAFLCEDLLLSPGLWECVEQHSLSMFLFFDIGIFVWHTGKEKEDLKGE